jgi:hypothetical protein
MKKIFISFDYANDNRYRNLLRAWGKNSRFELEFLDVTPEEIQSYDVGRIKAVLTSKIKNATHCLVIIGERANKLHPDRDLIGERNWQWWEIEKSYSEGKRFIAVKINSTNDSPTPIFEKNATWANDFNEQSILSAINDA